MPLPTPRLDDRRFQDIVDEAKRLIPRYCPEWTDHNVSDPGVTLIELFAWMTDMLLYRVNQVPDKLYINFLNLIGVRLEPPRAARAAVTFYLSAAQPSEITIPADTEVATVRTETNQATVFTTETALTVRPPQIAGAFTGGNTPSASWLVHDLRQLSLPGQRIPLFPPSLQPDDAFYLAFTADHSHHVLALVMTCEQAGGAGVDPYNPPVEWQVWQGGQTPWAPCVLEHDGTLGFNRSGEIILRTPAMAQRDLQGMHACWLRCRLTPAQASGNSYRVSPDLEQIRVEARGGTTNARHAITIRNEALGQSDGTPGQTFRLLHTPLLSRNPLADTLTIERPGGGEERWLEVGDFGESGPDDRTFTLDALDGTLTLGPALLQPDGNVYAFGAVPTKGSTLRFSRYQYGGGMIGNVPTGALTVLKSSIPYITRTMNWEPAFGGRDAESLENAKLRAPHALRTRTRAVTADDYEYLACQVPGVARARCLSPGEQSADQNGVRPGHIVLLALRQVEEDDGRIPPDLLTLSAELRAAVLTYLNDRRLIGTTLEVRAPRYQWVSVSATVHVAEGSDPALVGEVQRRAETELYRFLNPSCGGAGGGGWPFGRDLHVSEVYGLLLRILGVEYVEDVQLQISEPGTNGAPRSAGSRLTVPPDGVICSDRHEVRVR